VVDGASPGRLERGQKVAEVTDAPPKQGGETVEFDETTPARIADLLAEAKVI